GSVLLLIIGFIALSSFDNAKNIAHSNQNIVLDAENSAHLFNIPLQDYEIVEGVVGKNEFLSTLLQKYQVDLSTVSILAENAKPVFDVRRISAGNPYTIFLNKEGVAEYMVYQPNKIDYITFNLKDDIGANLQKKEVITEVKT